MKKSVIKFYRHKNAYDFSEATNKHSERVKSHKRLRRQDCLCVGQKQKQFTNYDDK